MLVRDLVIKAFKFRQRLLSFITDAAKYLVHTSELFKKEGIEVCDSWIDNVARDSNEEWREFLEEEQVSSKLCDDNSRNIEENMDIDQNSGDISYDGWCVVDERPAGVTDTLLQEPDSTESDDKIINVAPGEGSTPLGLFIDKDSEFLVFFVDNVGVITSME